MAGNTTWINWAKLAEQVRIDQGIELPPAGPHGLRPGQTYTVAGNLSEPKPGRTSRGKPMVRFDLRRKQMNVEVEPLPCVAFGRVAEHLADHVRRYGPTNPLCLIGEYQKDGEDYRFVVLRSRLPTLHLALSNAVRLGESFQHCS